MAAASVKLYNAWFCPFAQRAWIGLLYKGIQFEYIEQDPYNKTTEWLKVNPRGLVPALIHKNKVVYESPICLEYMEDAWPDTEKKLLPKDPFEKAHIRMWCDHVAKKLIPNFYALLMKHSDEDRREAQNSILTAVQDIQQAMSDDGPFFMGGELCMFDIVLWPHFYRIQTVTSHYRGFKIPEEKKFERILAWHKAMLNEECVKGTMADEGKLIQTYTQYEDDSATSEVATAIRRGTAMP